MKVKIRFSSKRDRDALIKDVGELDTSRNVATSFDDMGFLTATYDATIECVESVTVSEGGTHIIVKTERSRTQHRAWGAVRVEAEVTR